ncbi:MAG: hypothetical protein JKX75_06380 [Gammaproteobacteria bacterium]|nr:hypothetical protein [Gammaproteobacteria bacterium]
MWEFITETINSLTGWWKIFAWIVFIFICCAIIVGLFQGFELLTEVAFESIATGSEIAITKIARAFLIMVQVPVRGLVWIVSVIWIRAGLLAKKIHSRSVDFKLRAAKERDLRDFYNKHRERFKDWDHFQRWTADEGESNESTSVEKRDKYNEALEMFGLEKGFSQKEFKIAYRRLSSYVHPDKGCPTDFFAKQLTEAVRLINQRRNWK